MASEKNANAFPELNAPNNDSNLLIFDPTSNEGSRITFPHLADKSLDKLTEKTFTINSQQKTIVSALSDADNDIDELQADMAKLKASVGAPLVAETVSDMTDTDKVYVYVGSETGYTAGNWYYYDGSDWVSGGVYNSTAVETDKTLSAPDVPADAGAVGAALQGITVTITDQYGDGHLVITFGDEGSEEE